jgi:hypothetical protein
MWTSKRASRHRFSRLYRRPRIEPLEAREAPAVDFKILSLTPNNFAIVDHSAVTGDDRGGIAVSGTKLFVNGAVATGLFNKNDLSGGVAIAGAGYEALTSDLRTQKVYTLANAGAPLPFGGGAVTQLIELDGTTGAMIGTPIALSGPAITLGFDAGIFAGDSRILVHASDSHMYEIALPSGAVTDLGAMFAPPHNSSNGWAYWGVAERFDGKNYITAVSNLFGITRTEVPTGIPHTFFPFTNLGDMASFTVSPSNGRWYFHNEGFSQFFNSMFGFEEIAGYADASFEFVDLIVTNNNDSGPGSLRQAVLDSNNMAGLQTIGFDSSVVGPINLSTGAITIADSVKVFGPGIAMTVNGNAANPIFVDASGGTATMEIRGLTLSNPNGFANLPQLNVTGDLTLSAGVAGIAFSRPVNVAQVATLTLTSGNAIDMGPTTSIDGLIAASNGYLLGNGEILTGVGHVDGSVTIGSGGILTGDLTMGANVTVQNGGTLAPGVGVGTIWIVGNFIVENGGRMEIEFLPVIGLGFHDNISVTGTVNLGTGTNFFPTLNFVPNPGDVFTVIDNAGTDAIVGLLNGMRNRAGLLFGASARRFHLRYDGGSDNNDLVLITNTAPVLNTAVDTSMMPILEDVPPSSNQGTTVDALVATGGLYSDAEGLVRSGIAVTNLSGGTGSWQLSMNGGTTWSNFGLIAPNFATLLEADGAGLNRVRFSPNGDFFGTASISFTAWDVSNGRPDGSIGINAVTTDPNSAYSFDQETATILVLAVNDNPVAGADSYSVDEDDTLNVVVADGLLDNDSDADGPPPLTASILNGPAHGDLTLNADGSFTYDPDPDFNGSDSYTYKVSDGEGAFDIDFVTLTVMPKNDDPNAINDTLIVPEDAGQITIDVLGNDTIAPDAGETLTVSQVVSGPNGVAVIGPGGLSVRYTPNLDYSGPDAFTYVISDGNGGTDTATVNISVTSVNDDPDAINDSVELLEDVADQPIDVLTNDSLVPDPGETLTVTSVSQPLHGTVAIVGGGTSVTYTPDDDYSGPDTFLYTVSDGKGGSDVGAVTIKVKNDANDRLEVVTTNGITEFRETVPPALPPAPIAVDAGIELGTGNEGVISAATVKIAAGYVRFKDKLLYSTLGAIRGAFNINTGTLILRGIASPADYEAALRSVRFVNLSPAPVDGIRTITFKVQDAAGVGVEATKLLRVIGENTAAKLSIPATAVTYKVRGRPLAVAGLLKITDVDNTRLTSATVRITSGLDDFNDNLDVTVKVGSGILKNYDAGTGVLTLTGNATLATYLAVLRSLKFKTAIAGALGARTIEITVNDGLLNSLAVERTVNVV